MGMLKRILKSLKWYEIVIILILVILFSIFSYILIVYMRSLVDAVSITEKDFAIKIIFISGGFYMFFQLLSQLFNAINNFYCDYLQNIYASNLKIKVFNNLIKVDELYFKSKDYSKLTSSIVEDTMYISNNYFKPFFIILISIINFIVGFIFMSNINLYLSLLIIPLGLITAICSKKIEVLTKKNLSKQKNLLEYSWKLFGEGIKGIKLIKIFDNKEYIENIEENSIQLSKVSIRQLFIDNFGEFIIGTLYMVTIGLILLISSIFVYKKIITFGGLVSLVMYNHMLVDPLLNFIEVNQKLVKLEVSTDRLDEILGYKKLDKEKTDIQIQKIILENIDFSYDSKMILNNFSYTFEKNKKYCITGKTGRGKSTLINIISGYLDPISGKVCFTTENNKIEQNKIPTKISYLLQDAYLFNTTIEENIKIVNPLIKNNKITKLINDCCLLEVHTRVKKEIGDNGNLLSGGERKRLLLAMALAKSDVDVFIFDELSSSLDKNTYNQILKNIRPYLLNKISIFIEHQNIDVSYYDEFIDL